MSGHHPWPPPKREAAPVSDDRRWWFAYCDREEVGAFMDEGWEPFAIDARGSGIGAGRQVTVYLKKLVELGGSRGNA